MASTAYRQRSSSPFRSFHKPASVDGHIPGYSHQYSASSTPTAHHYSSPAPAHYQQQHHPRGRSLTPTRARSMTPPTFKFKFGSPSSARSNGYHGIPPLSYSPSMDYHHQSTGGDSKENVLVTVRFRPLSLREIHRGDEVAWYADGETIVRSEYNPTTAYAFDRVFGPATTTKAIYDSAAKQVVRGAMEGVNGTVFAYGVTSSGKTHTMHGDQRSPGIIPLAVKDVFSIIQDTPGREYLLRVSYLEIYNEVINDLLDPAGQNLRIREDSQGTYVEGVKEEVVLSPAHALSLIAAGEEHRHVGSNNFNLLSSRSHTIFTLTIESSSRTGDCYEDEITLSQLNLIDLAGSESSKTETTGLRRKEGSYINKSLLTLGTVIGKLSGDSKASHVPFRDSKLTRLLQSSLSGHGRVSLICTLTPASSNIEETHNTLKFAQRAKRVAIYAAPNRIMDEKSLIKKYQKEISSLKHELEQLKRGIFDKSYLHGTTPEDLLTLRQQLEAGQVKLQSRLEEEEQAKAALLGRIQRLTKLILVSTKNSTLSNEPEYRNHRRHHSFSEEDLKYLGEKMGGFTLDFDDAGNDLESSTEGKLDGDDVAKEDKKNKRRGMLGWFKLKRNGTFNSTMSMDADISPNGSPGSGVHTTELNLRRSFSRKTDDSIPAFVTQAGELFSAAVHGRRPPPTGETVADQMDLLREQAKMLAGEVAFCTSSLKRMSEQALLNPDDTNLQAQMEKTKEEIQQKRKHIEILERRIVEAGQAALNNASPLEMSETISKLMGQLNEKEFELEIKTADNRILQEQLQNKISEIKQLHDTIATMQQQSQIHKDPTPDPALQNQLLKQGAEIERLKQDNDSLIEENGGLQVQGQKLAEEANYAKELASAAAVELKTLAEEVKKLSLQNTQLANDLVAVQEASFSRMSNKPTASGGFGTHVKINLSNGNTDCDNDIDAWELDPEDMKRELHARKEREAGLEAALSEKEQIETELRKKLEEAKQRESVLENDLAGMWVLVAKMKKERGATGEPLEMDIDNPNLKEIVNNGISKDCNGFHDEGTDKPWKTQREEADKKHNAIEELQRSIEEEKLMNKELRCLVSKLKGEELDGLSISNLEEIQNLHMEALTKLCQAKARSKHYDKDRDHTALDKHREDNISHICKVCFEAPTATVLLPCRHFCLCKPCAVACTECPLCRSGIADRIITFTS